MKVLMTTDTLGGVWTYALQLAAALEPHGVEVALATSGRELNSEQRQGVAALRNVRLYESRYKLEWMQEPWEDLRAAGRWLLRITDEFEPDVIHLNDYAHGALEWRAPVLMVGHSCVLSWFRQVRHEDAGPEWNRYRELTSRGLQSAQLVAAPTRSMLDWLDEFYGPLPRRQAIWNGRGLPRGPAFVKQPLVLAAGRLWDEAKNIGTLAAAAGQIRWPVCIAGETEHPDGGAARFTGLRTLGRLAPSRMADVFRRASIYAHPARYEPFGLTPLEAALAGCALVLSDIPTLREIWNGAATFVPSDDCRGLAQAVNGLIADAALRRRQANRAQARAAMFTPRRMAERYLDAYRGLCRNAAGRSHDLSRGGV